MTELALVGFLTQRLGEDEAAARAALPDPDDDDQRTIWESEFAHRFDDGDLVLRFDPARVLAECESKRAIVASECAPYPNGHAPATVTLRLLAQPFADRPGFDEAWRVHGHKEAQG